MERFSAGLVLSTGLRMFARHGLRFLPFAMILHVPLLLLPARSDLLTFVVDVPAAAMISHAVVHDLRGARAGFWSSVASGLVRTPHSLGVMFLVLLVSAAVFIAVGSIPVVGEAPALLVILCLAGVATVIVLLYSRWFVVIPAVVLERPGLVGALSRSGAMTRGRRAQIVAVLVLVGVAHAAAFVTIAYLHREQRIDDPWIRVAYLGLFALFGPLRAALSATAYHHLRTEREAGSPEQLAKVFD